MERGYVKLWRKTLDSGLLQHPTALQVFTYLMLKAAGKPCKRIVSGQAVELEVGQVLTSRSTLSTDLGITEKQVRTSLGLLEKLEIVAIKRASKYSVVSFVNWSTYQHVQPTEGPADSPTEGPSKGQVRARLKEVKKEEDINYSSESPNSDPSGNCPHNRILDVYREVLPEMTQPRTWRANEMTALKARWNEKRKEGKFTTEEEGVEYFRKFFQYVRKSDFLMGKVTNRDGKAFQADIRWLVKAGNFDKVVEGKYHER